MGHGRDSFFIVGEGLIGQDAAGEGVAMRTSMDTEARAFRFSRIGPRSTPLPPPALVKIGAAMTKPGAGRIDSKVPAGYTYLGQFVDHDLTFDKSALRDSSSVLVSDLIQSRSPALDLDSLYGFGPKRSPAFYADDGVKLKVGRTDANRVGFDLPRKGRKPNIPDVRNDENLAVGQTHLAFIRFHNRVVDRLAADGVPAAQRFAKARETVVKHYQWMLRHDFLPRIVNPGVLDAVFTDGRRIFEVSPPPGDPPTMPVEFSVAAYRLGHSMIRDAYDWNAVFPGTQGTLEALFTFSGTGGDLSAQSPLPDIWIADWRRLYDFAEAGKPNLVLKRGNRRVLNFARRIDTVLADPLRQLPTRTLAAMEPLPAGLPRFNLAFRNLMRGRMIRLASGAAMLAHIKARGVTMRGLTQAQLLTGKRGADLSALTPPQRQALVRDPPLWFYALREAELNNGLLRGVGARIVAETFHRAMEGSQHSIVTDTAFRPSLGPNATTFRMVDLLLFAFEGKKALLAPRGD